MPLRQLKSIYENRKRQLADILGKDSKLDKSRKEQIIGAMSEIDTLLKTIETLRQQEIEDNARLDYKTEIKTSPANIFLNKLGDKVRVRFDNSKTKKNLMSSFMRKSDTRMKYEFFSGIASKDGYEQVANIFRELADNEREHARVIFQFLNWEHPTMQNIKEAADIEQYHHNTLYADYEDVAAKENFKDIALLFKHLSNIESEHEKRLLNVMRNFHEKKLFRSEHVVRWKCRNCGHVTEGKEAPKKCPLCKQSQAYFELHQE